MIDTILASVSLIIWLYLAFFHSRFWLPFVADEAVKPEVWPSVDIIVPARNEAEVMPGSLPSLLAQDYPGAWRIILVDDHSNDGTADLARRLAKTKGLTDRLMVVNAPTLPERWTGKLSALNTGVGLSSSEYILFTDADIYHPTDSLRRMVSRAIEKRLDLTSLMVKLHCADFAEKLLIPAFVFFFAMLYPFRRASDQDSHVAAAAGGVMLVKRDSFNRIGGFTHIKGALIDDCALARVMKDSNCTIELTNSRDVRSLRTYPDISDIKQMISRTAFTQLNYSTPLLALTILGLALMFAVPILAALFGNLVAVRLGLVTWLVMSMIYLPTIRFYRLPFFWAAMLPAAAAIYVSATIDSARLYWQGKGGSWKGRDQA